MCHLTIVTCRLINGTFTSYTFCLKMAHLLVTCRLKIAHLCWVRLLQTQA